jgi:hypothetical protein
MAIDNMIVAHAVRLLVRITQLPGQPRLLRGLNPDVDYEAAVLAVNKVGEVVPFCATHVV